MPSLELKLTSVNENADIETTEVKYYYNVGNFSGFDKSVFLREPPEVRRQNFNGILSPDQIMKRLLPELYAEAKKQGYKTFQ